MGGIRLFVVAQRANKGQQIRPAAHLPKNIVAFMARGSCHAESETRLSRRRTFFFRLLLHTFSLDAQHRLHLESIGLSVVDPKIRAVKRRGRLRAAHFTLEHRVLEALERLDLQVQRPRYAMHESRALKWLPTDRLRNSGRMLM
jgi:hypothetical protein